MIALIIKIMYHSQPLNENNFFLNLSLTLFFSFSFVNYYIFIPVYNCFFFYFNIVNIDFLNILKNCLSLQVASILCHSFGVLLHLVRQNWLRPLLAGKGGVGTGAVLAKLVGQFATHK